MIARSITARVFRGSPGSSCSTRHSLQIYNGETNAKNDTHAKYTVYLDKAPFASEVDVIVLVIAKHNPKPGNVPTLSKLVISTIRSPRLPCSANQPISIPCTVTPGLGLATTASKVISAQLRSAQSSRSLLDLHRPQPTPSYASSRRVSPTAQAQLRNPYPVVNTQPVLALQSMAG